MKLRIKLTALCMVLAVGLAAPSHAEDDIRVLNQHFNTPGADISPWMFVPEENIKEISTKEAPGLATIWQAGKGKDIKGILEEPIRIDDYPLPWTFHMGLVQNWSALQGFGSKNQMNYAIGLNVAVTFSDPSTWPEDRTQRPPDTHDFQLLVVHLGATGEFAPGLPQYSARTHPETWLLYGRGDLDHRVMGDWQPYRTGKGSGGYSGPAAQEVYFSCSVSSPTSLQVGFQWQTMFPPAMRTIDCSKFGEITGIWEIGPIFSCDRWIPDVLCRHLPQQHLDGGYFAGSQEPGYYKPRVIYTASLEPEPPDPTHEFYLDYCTFVGPGILDHVSDDFDIRGYLANWHFQLPYAAETWSNPGYLTVTHLGQTQWSGFSSTSFQNLEMDRHIPPVEIEYCVTTPDNSVPWNSHFYAQIYDSEGKEVGLWLPGVQNYPSENLARFHNYSTDYALLKAKHLDWYLLRDLPQDRILKPVFELEFESEIPNEILLHKPLYVLLQIIDPSHVRIGFKANPEDPWFLSKTYDCSEVTKGGISRIGGLLIVNALGRDWGKLPGAPMYQQYLYDYVHYRQGLSTTE